MSKTIVNDSTDLMTAIIRCDLKTQKLLRKSNWCGRKAFLVFDCDNKWHVVVLNLIQRIKRWFGAKEFANTRPACLAQNLKDSEIEAILQSDSPALKAAAYRITRFHKKWLTVKLFVTQLVALNNALPQELIRKLLNHKIELKKAQNYLKKHPAFFYPTAGNVHLDIASYFIEQTRNKTPHFSNSKEMNLWGRITEVLRRAGWDINGSRWPGTGSAYSAFHFCAQSIKPQEFAFVDFYLEHGGDPTKMGTALPPLFYYFKDETSMQKVVDYSKRKGLDLKTFDFDRYGYRNVLEYAARNGEESVIKFYVNNGLTFDAGVLENWVSRGHDLKLIMSFLKHPSDFTQHHLNTYNKAVRERQKIGADLTMQDIETIFNEAVFQPIL